MSEPANVSANAAAAAAEAARTAAANVGASGNANAARRANNLAAAAAAAAQKSKEAAASGNAAAAAAAAANANKKASEATEEAAKAPTASKAGAPPAAPPAPSANNRPSKALKGIQTFGLIGVESGLGFTAGAMMGKGNIPGGAATIAALSIVVALEFWFRYNMGKTSWLLFAGAFALIAAGVVPYVTMSKAGKGKAKDKSTVLPTTVGAWSFMAIVFGLVCAKLSGDAVAMTDALQGVILTLLYTAVSASIGFNTGSGQGKSPTTMMAVGTWSALALFDFAGILRDPTAA